MLTVHPRRRGLDPARLGRAAAANTQAKVVGPGHREALGRNQDGELCFRGPQVMRGYLNRPQETAHMLGSDGWLRSGDIGHVDDDGYFYVVDRVKELIKYKGLQVAPAELEAVLVSHPAIADAAVVRLPTSRPGRSPSVCGGRRRAVSPAGHRLRRRARRAPQEGPRRRVRRRFPGRCRARSRGACSWSATGRRRAARRAACATPHGASLRPGGMGGGDGLPRR